MAAEPYDFGEHLLAVAARDGDEHTFRAALASILNHQHACIEALKRKMDDMANIIERALADHDRRRARGLRANWTLVAVTLAALAALAGLFVHH